jgi:hypothetical protein
MLHAQLATLLQQNTFLTGIHRLLVTNKERSPSPIANQFQGQLQTPQSVCILTASKCHPGTQRSYKVPK